MSVSTSACWVSELAPLSIAHTTMSKNVCICNKRKEVMGLIHKQIKIFFLNLEKSEIKKKQVQN